MAKQEKDHVYYVIVVTIVAIATTGIADAGRCPPRCVSCAGGVANCKARSLTAPPKSYPLNTRIVDLEGNHIRILGVRSFHNQQTVEILKLNDNKVVTVRNDAFRTFPRLMTLDLTGNRITRLYPRAFAGLGRLQTLSLSRNRIRRIAGLFRGASNLHQLNLAENKLIGIHQNDLAPLSRMRYLDYRNNLISRIHPRAFDNLANLRYLFLNNNPIAEATANLQLSPTPLQLLDMSNCELTAFPGSLPATVSEVRMGNNKIMQINYTDFENVTNLQMLTLNNNELHFLADGALTHLTNLKEIWLRGNNLVYVPRDIPPNVIRLYMDSNRIQEIEAGLFSNESLLEFFSGANNNLRRVDPGTFEGMNRLKTINLQGNRLQVLESRTFADLDDLETIMLSNNPLHRIERAAFENLPKLKQLSVSYLQPDVTEVDYNFLSEMPQLENLQIMASPGLGQAFVDMVADAPESDVIVMPSVTAVDLSYNNIQYVNPRLAVVFPQLQSMFLDGNPFNCAQNMSWIKTWLSTPGITFHQYDEPRCENPYSLRGRAVQSITPREFREGGSNSNPADLNAQLRRRRGHTDTSNRDVQKKKTNDKTSSSSSSSSVQANPTEPTGVSKKAETTTTHLQLRAQREERRRKVRRNRSRKGKGKKRGKGKKNRRNKKGKGRKKNKQNGKRLDKKKNKSRGKSSSD